MTALARRGGGAVAIPTGGGGGEGRAQSEGRGPGGEVSVTSGEGGPLRFLAALPAVYLDAARGLWNDPSWVRSRHYVPNMAAHRAHDIEVARLKLAKYGEAKLLALFPEHAALLGIEAAGARGATCVDVTVTVVEPTRPERAAPLALPAGPSSPTFVPVETRHFREVAR